MIGIRDRLRIGALGRALHACQTAFYHTAADLAFRNHHRRQGEPPKTGRTTRDETNRRRLVTLRHELSSERPFGDD